MKHRIYLFLILGISLHGKIIAQNSTERISGVITDENGKPLAGTTILLQDLKDTTRKEIKIGDDNGAFVFKNVPVGIYSMTCSHIGFTEYKIDHLNSNDTHGTIKLSTIVLKATAYKNLKEIIITSKKPLIEQRTDRTIVNVDAMISAAGSNALEVLAKAPGVFVDPNGGIQLNGQGGVLVLIDDKSTYLSAQDLAAYLRSLPASLLDKIELMSNPPARYDASGSSIINLQLKKNRTAGFNGNINLGYSQGAYVRSNNGLNINYRTKKMNFFCNLSYSRDANYASDNSSRYFYDMNGDWNSTILLNSYYRYSSRSWNARTGLDYFISPTTTIGFVVAGNIRPKTDLLNYSANQFKNSMLPDSISNGTTSGNFHWKSDGANFNFQHNFKGNGGTLTADLDYIQYLSDGSRLSPSFVYSGSGGLTDSNTILSQTPSDINIYAAKTDYTLTLKGKIEFDAGLKSSFVNTNDENNRFDQAGASFIPDFSNTNHFIYRENINAAYISARKEWLRWGIQGGLRMENTQAKGHQIANIVVPDSSFTRKYTRLFPSLFLSYKLDKAGNNTLVLSYSIRIKRPNYQQLDPFLTYVNQYTYGAGNPYLTPQYNYISQLKYSYKQYFGLIVAYYHTNPIIYGVTERVGNIFISRPENFGTNNSINFTAYLKVSPLKWWDINTNILVFNLTNKGNAFGQIINNNHTTGEIELSNQFRFGHLWSAELACVFHGPGYGGQSVTDPNWFSSAGIQRKIWKDKGAIRLKIDDIFHTRITRFTSTLNEATYTRTSKSDSRVLGLSFSYRFGKDANARKRNTTGSAEDEKGRTN